MENLSLFGRMVTDEITIELRNSEQKRNVLQIFDLKDVFRRSFGFGVYKPVTGKGANDKK